MCSNTSFNLILKFQLVEFPLGDSFEASFVCLAAMNYLLIMSNVS